MNAQNRHSILVVDDEPDILSSLNRLLRRDYNVLLANSALEGIKLLEQHEVHVILTDQRMPEMEGVEFLAKIKGEYPDAIPLLLTGYADLNSVINAINSGNIYRYLVKPWNPDELLDAIQQACQKFDLIVQNRQLTQNLLLANSELEERIQERTAKLERANTYLMVLSEVGTRLQDNLNYDQVILTLESELEKYQLGCLVALCEENNQFNSIYLSDNSFIRIEGEEIEKECSLQYKEIPEFVDISNQRNPSFIVDMENWSNRILNRSQTKIPPNFVRLKNVSPMMKGTILPLWIKQRFTGVLMIWGHDLVENDLIALSIFANQVGIALENSFLFGAVHRLAVLDGLTGVYNRRQIIEMAQREFARAKRTRHPFSLIMVDVDDFKRVNDTYGHGIGDLVLRSITNYCQEVLRKEVDMIGRYGGDEFLILLPETDLAVGREIATRLHTYIQRQSIVTQLGSISISISLGVSSFTEQISHLEDLLDQADQAMYQAKQINKK